MTQELIRKEMQMIKDMGANFIRLAHIQQSPIALHLCDEMGFLAWEGVERFLFEAHQRDLLADDAEEQTKRIEETRSESQQKAHENDLYWLFCLTPEIDELVGQLHASLRMLDKYNQLSAQQKISPDEATCLQDEKNSKNCYETRLRDKLTEAMERGTGMFRGVQKDASALGKGLGEILKKLFGQVVPDLYPKLQMGSRSLNLKRVVNRQH